VPETTAIDSGLSAAMSELEDARGHLRNAAKHLLELGSPIHQRVCLQMDEVSKTEAQIVEFSGRTTHDH